MLEGTRILDLSWVLGGPFAGQLLAQLGAEVIKVESLEGDGARSIPPHFVEGESTFFLSVNRGKRSIALDLRSEAGLEVFYDLVRESDAVIYGFRPDVPSRLRIDYESLKAVNPRICVGQLVGIDDKEGPDAVPAFDLVVQALSGLMSITGEPGRPPARVGYQVADLAGGAYLALATVSALMQTFRSGTGRHVQVSLLDTQFSLLTWQAQNYLATGEVPTPRGSRHHMIAPSEAFRGSDDRHFVISPTGEKFWRLFCQAIDWNELIEDPRFKTAQDRIENVESLSTELQEHFQNRSSEEWVDTLRAAGVPAATVLSVAEALSQPVARSRDMVETLEQPQSHQSLDFLGNPFKLRPSGDMPDLAYPPRLGEHGREILAELCGYSETHLDHLFRKQVLTEPTSTSER